MIGIGPPYMTYEDAVAYFARHGTLISSTADEVLSKYPEYNDGLREILFPQMPKEYQTSHPLSPPPPPSPPPLSVEDTSLNQALIPSIQAYTGPVTDVQHEYINTGTDSLNISAATPNWFIHSGSGNDAIAVSSGTNVLDGGTGSNFLTGGSGADTFFVDDRGHAADIWSTVNNFHAGDAATIWGITPQDYSLDWVDGQGAAGYTGLTFACNGPGRADSITNTCGFYQVGSQRRAPLRLLRVVERQFLHVRARQ